MCRFFISFDLFTFSMDSLEAENAALQQSSQILTSDLKDNQQLIRQLTATIKEKEEDIRQLQRSGGSVGRHAEVSSPVTCGCHVMASGDLREPIVNSFSECYSVV